MFWHKREVDFYAALQDQTRSKLDQDGDDLLLILATIRRHTEACCREGHSCKKPDKCRARCADCSADAKAAHEAHSRKRERLADLILKNPEAWAEFQALKAKTRG